MDLLCDIWFPPESLWVRREVNSRLNFQKICPNYTAALVWRWNQHYSCWELNARNPSPLLHELLPPFASGVRPGLPRSVASVFAWQSLVPHVVHLLISRTEPCVDMCNDRARSWSCIVLAKEARSSSQLGVRLYWGCRADMGTSPKTDRTGKDRSCFLQTMSTENPIKIQNLYEEQKGYITLSGPRKKDD